MESLDDLVRDQESVENPADLIMTAEEYVGVEHEAPYVYRVIGNGAELVYFGARHSRTVNDVMFTDLQSEFENFKPDIVLVEGVTDLEDRKGQKKDWLRDNSIEHIIAEMGEAGFPLKLAVENNIDFISPEPGLRAEAEFLEEQGFSRDEIFAYYVYSDVPQWHQHEIKPVIREYLEHDIQNIAHDLGWSDYDFSFDHAMRIGEAMWGAGLNLEDEDYYSTRTDPIPWKGQEEIQSTINLVSRASSRFGDQHMIGKIGKIIEIYKRPFVVFGGSHAVMQEPAIRKLIESRAEIV